MAKLYLSVAKRQACILNFCEFLVKSGIDCISVNPDAVVNLPRKLVAQVEQRVMLDALTGRGRMKKSKNLTGNNN